MNARKITLIKQNQNNLDVVLEPIKVMMTARNYERLMDSTLAQEGLVFLNYEFGPNVVKTCHARYTYLFIDLLTDIGRIYRRFEVGHTPREHILLDPIVSILATWILHDIHDATFDEELTPTLIRQLGNALLKHVPVDKETAAKVRRAVREHIESHTYQGRYNARTTLIWVYQPRP